MKPISDILFIISNGLLIPVILSLLFLLSLSLIRAIGFYHLFREHRRISDALKTVVGNYSLDSLKETLDSLNDLEDSPEIRCLRLLVSHSADADYCEHALGDYQIEIERKLSKSRLLVKFGPMLGLMGTLIPMGPALVGLSAGDISSVAYNMQVAFATTVIGMLIAAIGLLQLQSDKRFFARSFNDIEFILRKIIGI